MADKDLQSALAELSDEDRKELLKGLGVETDVVKMIEALDDAGKADIAKMFAPTEDERKAGDERALDKFLKALGIKKDVPKPTIEDDNVRKAIETLTDRVEKAEADTKAADERTAEAEKRVTKMVDAKALSDHVQKAAQLGNLSTTADDLGGMLLEVTQKLSPESAKGLNELLAAANDQVGKADLYGEIGSSRAGLASDQKMAVAVVEAKKANPTFTDAQASAHVLKNNAALYAEVRKGEDDRKRGLTD